MERYEISQAIVKALRRCGHFLHYKMGDKAGQRRIFFALLKQGEVLQRDLQDMLGVQSGSISEIVGKMESEGLVEKVRSEADGRNLVLKLTERGAGQAERQRSEYDGKIASMMSCLDDSEQEELFFLLEKLTKHWERLDGDADFSSPASDGK